MSDKLRATLLAGIIVCAFGNVYIAAQTADDYYNRGVNAYTAGNYDLAITEYSNAIRINPNDGEAYHNRGLAYHKKGLNDLAIADYSRAISLGQGKADTYYARGLSYEKNGNYDQVITDLSQSIRLDPSRGDAFIVRGAAYFKKKAYDLAVADMNEGIRLSPSAGDAYRIRGASYWAKGSDDQAIADFTRALQLSPNDWAANLGRGIANAGKMQCERAIPDLSIALEHNQTLADAWSARGACYLTIPDYVRAKSDFDRALAINPTLYQAVNGRKLAVDRLADAARPPNEKALAAANASFGKGAYAEALDFANESIRLNPTYSAAYQRRALINVKLGIYERAISDQARAIDLDPKYPAGGHDLAWVNFIGNRGLKASENAAAFLEVNGLKGEQAPYAIIVGYLGLCKSGKMAAAKSFLDGWVKQISDTAWPTGVLKFLHGDITAAQLLAASDTNDKLTEAHVYIAEMQLIAGTPKTAIIHLNWVKDNGNKTFWEYDLAIAELSRLVPKAKNPGTTGKMSASYPLPLNEETNARIYLEVKRYLSLADNGMAGYEMQLVAVGGPTSKPSVAANTIRDLKAYLVRQGLKIDSIRFVVLGKKAAPAIEIWSVPSSRSN